MDTLIFALLLATALIIIFNKRKWLILSSYVVSFIAVLLLFLHHVTSTLDLNF